MKFPKLLLISSVALFAACEGSDDSNSTSEGALRIINAMTDSPALILSVNEDDDTLSTIQGLAYQGLVNSSTLSVGNYEIEVEYQDPIESTVDSILSDEEISILSNTLHTVILTGDFDAPQITVLETDVDADFDDDIDEFELQVINLSSISIDVYLEGQLNADGQVLTSLTAGNSTTADIYEDYDDSEYGFIIKNTADETVFDSGDTDFSVSSRNLLVVTDSVGVDSSKVSAFLVNSSFVLPYTNKEVDSYVRVVNFIPDDASTTVDVSYSATEENILNTSMGFGSLTDIGIIETGFLDIEATSDTDTSLVKTSAVSLSNDTYETILIGGLWGQNDITISSINSDFRPIADQTELVFVNGINDIDDDESVLVDVYAVEVGTGLSDSSPICSSVSFMNNCSGNITASTYDFVITETGTQIILAGPVRETLSEKTAHMIIATELLGGGEPYSLTSHALNSSL